MYSVVAGGEDVALVSGEDFGPRTAGLSGLIALDPPRFGDHELSDLELLSGALQDALDARSAGRLVGPDADEVALRRAERRAHRADVARLLRSQVGA
jgi:hypothetical protein